MLISTPSECLSEATKKEGTARSGTRSGTSSISGRKQNRFAPPEPSRRPSSKNLPEFPPVDRFQQFAKIALPHLALYILLFLYLIAGAWAFVRIEYPAERLQQLKKLRKIEAIYRQIASEVSDQCALYSAPPGQRTRLNERLYDALSKISQFFEGPQFELHAYQEADLNNILPSKWNTMSSVLYALSILTTTGCQTTPMTPLGQWFSIGYGLIGIPLMILAAVDVGRFLSDVVLFLYGRISRTLSMFFGVKRIGPKQEEVASPAVAENKKTLEVISSKENPHQSGGGGFKSRITNLSVKPKLGGRLKKRRGGITKNKAFGGEEAEQKKRLPLSVNAAILLMFCMLGGVVYVGAGGSQSFIEGFFVTFNLVANLTMSEMPADISHFLTLIYIFLFVTFGLAVLSMCADLAASELKWLFLKIHYFGRKINWKRKTGAAALKQADEELVHPEMEMEVKELLKIIDQIRARYPEKHEISSLDILKYVQELNGMYGGATAYRTFDMYLAHLHHQRRETLAFTPQSFDALKFADELVDEASEPEAANGGPSSPPFLQAPAAYWETTTHYVDGKQAVQDEDPIVPIGA